MQYSKLLAVASLLVASVNAYPADNLEKVAGFKGGYKRDNELDNRDLDWTSLSSDSDLEDGLALLPLVIPFILTKIEGGKTSVVTSTSTTVTTVPESETQSVVTVTAPPQTVSGPVVTETATPSSAPVSSPPVETSAPAVPVPGNSTVTSSYTSIVTVTQCDEHKSCSPVVSTTTICPEDEVTVSSTKTDLTTYCPESSTPATCTEEVCKTSEVPPVAPSSKTETETCTEEVCKTSEAPKSSPVAPTSKTETETCTEEVCKTSEAPKSSPVAPTSKTPDTESTVTEQSTSTLAGESSTPAEVSSYEAGAAGKIAPFGAALGALAVALL
ncbi:hypothetical protein HYPBUDRAFT_151380 [Hyphopichia burtonii NRRL Y-1933]|uniref:Uncharacterized protein n=1 Tax=Hyphopichia burtonii NRRL Y-1933 TaxID=984485 RepID=A0A1E4RR78_9ASCO|nr:hypothetical protein HYPBUDRAFT_151380 [Hyphopichia burtonii NRRL Y-1933]ODV69757.1 hypothetical protein HYPBUDRAFT_151380 [Hyphopichia burtonii NRRL Y-1933]